MKLLHNTLLSAATLLLSLIVVGGADSAPVPADQIKELQTVAMRDWHVSPVLPDKPTNRPYCAIATEYGGNVIVTHARNNFGLGTMAFDLPDVSVEAGQHYLLSLNAGDMIKRDYAARAVTDSLLVVKTGNDRALFNILEKGVDMNITIDNGLTGYRLKGSEKAFFEFGFCLQGLEQPNRPNPVVVKVPVIEQTVIKEPQPLTADVAQTLNQKIQDYNAPAGEEPEIIEEVAWVSEEVGPSRQDEIVTSLSQDRLRDTDRSKESLKDRAVNAARLAVNELDRGLPSAVNASIGRRNRVISQSLDEPRTAPLPTASPEPDVPLKSLLELAGIENPDIRAVSQEKGLIRWRSAARKTIDGYVHHVAVFNDLPLTEFVMADIDALEQACDGEFLAEIGLPEAVGYQTLAKVETICDTGDDKILNAQLYQLSDELLSVWSVEGPYRKRDLILIDRDNISQILKQRANVEG